MQLKRFSKVLSAPAVLVAMGALSLMSAAAGAPDPLNQGPAAVQQTAQEVTRYLTAQDTKSRGVIPCCTRSRTATATRIRSS